jgi:hypothetical protein
VLVVNDYQAAEHHGVNPYLPAKVADYAGSGTPVWAVCEPGSVMSAMSFAHRTEVGDLEAALGVLRTLIADPAGQDPLDHHPDSDHGVRLRLHRQLVI